MSRRWQRHVARRCRRFSKYFGSRAYPAAPRRKPTKKTLRLADRAAQRSTAAAASGIKPAFPIGPGVTGSAISVPGAAGGFGSALCSRDLDHSRHSNCPEMAGRPSKSSDEKEARPSETQVAARQDATCKHAARDWAPRDARSALTDREKKKKQKKTWLAARSSCPDIVVPGTEKPAATSQSGCNCGSHLAAFCEVWNLARGPCLASLDLSGEAPTQSRGGKRLSPRNESEQ